MRTWIFVAGSMAALAPFCLAQDHLAVPARSCTPPDIDVHALPPATKSTAPKGHLLVLEVRNIGPTPCRVDAPALTLLPRVHFADETNADFEELRSNPGPYRLDPKEWVHVLVAWVSDAPPEVQCVDRSGLRVWFLRTIPASGGVSVEVRDSAVRSCSTPYISGYRRGHYSVESRVSAAWISGISPQRVDDFRLPVESTWDRIQRSSSWLRADAHSSRTMLGDYLGFRVRFQRQSDRGCPYRLVRMRESTGLTAIVVAQCPRGGGVSDLPVPRFAEPGVLRLDLGRLGLLAKHAGSVEYNIISAADNSTRPVFVEARVSLIVHDPTLPTQAVVANPLPACTAPQLRVAVLDAVVRERWKTLRAYEATNVSEESCSLAGVPLLRSVRDNGGRLPFNNPSLCPNCPNDMFSPRPNGRVDLKPGEKAHVLIGATAINTDDDPWMHCEPTRSLVLWPSTDLPPNVGEPAQRGIALALDARVCAGVDVSTWRTGAFDGDPHNIHWSARRRSNSEDFSASERACNTAELLAMGTPRLISMRPNIAFGISASQSKFVLGERITLQLWVNNTSDVPVGVMTCGELDYFKARGFDLYDAYGHRVLDQTEARFAERCRTDPGAPKIERIWICTRNFPIPIPAHTCITKSEYDFTIAVSERFRLPVGEYTIRFRDNRVPFEPRCGSSDGPVYQAGLGTVTFAVVQP